MIQRLVIVMTIMGLAHNELLELTCNDIKKFVDGHNKRRLQVAKGELKDQPAGVINSVNWDEELAAKAGKWASTDPSFHNPNRTIASKRFITGENMYWSVSGPTSTLDPETVLSEWFADHDMYTYGDRLYSPYRRDEGTSDHYTQMVWSNSTYIGCAIAKTLHQNITNFYVVCNYGPTGNKQGEVPYEELKQGSKTLSCGIADCSKLYGKKCPNKILRLTFDLRITN